MLFLKQSTTVDVLLGPALDATDGVTEETGLSPTVYLSKNGAGQGARNSATAITHDARGYYIVELDDTDTNTLGRLRVLFHDYTTHLPVWQDFMVVPANVWNSLVGGTDLLDTNASQLGGTAQTGEDVGADLASIVADGVAIEAAAEASLVDAVWDEPLTGATHNDPTSAGRRLRTLGDVISSAVDDGSASETAFDTDLSGSYADDHFNDQLILFTSGNLSGQVRPILSYVDSGGTITVEEPFTEAPANNDTFDIIPDHIHSHAQIAQDVATLLDEIVEAEGSYTLQQVLSVVLAVLAGETADGGTTIKTPDGAATRVEATIDASANRTAMSVTPSS